MWRKLSDVFAKELNRRSVRRWLIVLGQSKVGQNRRAVEDTDGRHGGHEGAVNWCEREVNKNASGESLSASSRSPHRRPNCIVHVASGTGGAS